MSPYGPYMVIFGFWNGKTHFVAKYKTDFNRKLESLGRWENTIGEQKVYENL